MGFWTRRLARRLILLFALIFTFSILNFQFSIPARASENFITDYHVIYAVSEDGTTHASVNGSLTNATSDYYVASYKMQLGFENLVNIQASDTGGMITPDVTKTDSGQLIELRFNKNVVGLGNKQTFKITFDTPDITQQQGNVWEINIPGIADQEQFNTFDVELTVPKSFGPTAYVKPCEGICNKTRLVFSKDELGKSGISIAFGDKQIYSYDLTYHLKNSNLFPIRTEIALPPNTNYQEVFLDSLSPEPLQVYADEDGNWLAQYTIAASKRLDVHAKGNVVLSLYPKKEIRSDNELKPYLQEEPYWQLSNEKVKAAAKDLDTPEEIYNYVVKTLTYDFSRVTSNKPRIGAIGVLQNPSSAVCLEFTDLFIALARAAGIPAREVDGYAYTENPKQRPLSLVQDILHAWPEYYDKDRQTWIMIDPTWGNTTGGVDYFHTLDFDHFTFVKKGVSSTYPIPAGGYKIEGDENKKDVSIAFADEIVHKPTEITIAPLIENSFIAGLPIFGSVEVINKGPGVSSEKRVRIYSDALTPVIQYKQIPSLLPYEKKELAFHFDKKPFLTNKEYTITMGLNDCQSAEERCITKSIKVIPIYIKEWKLLGGVFIALFTSIILIIAIKTRRLRVS